MWLRFLNSALGFVMGGKSLCCLLQAFKSFRDFKRIQFSWRNYLPAHYDIMAAEGWLEKGSAVVDNVSVMSPHSA